MVAAVFSFTAAHLFPTIFTAYEASALHDAEGSIATLSLLSSVSDNGFHRRITSRLLPYCFAQSQQPFIDSHCAVIMVVWGACLLHRDTTSDSYARVCFTLCVAARLSNVPQGGG